MKVQGPNYNFRNQGLQFQFQHLGKQPRAVSLRMRSKPVPYTESALHPPPSLHTLPYQLWLAYTVTLDLVSLRWQEVTPRDVMNVCR